MLAPTAAILTGRDAGPPRGAPRWSILGLGLLAVAAACGGAGRSPRDDAGHVALDAALDAPSDAGHDAGLAPDDLAALLTPILADRGVPALGAAVVVGTRLQALGVVGVRKVGDPTPATPGDRWHLGSCTKAMTATLAATLVDQGELGWTDTLAASFPEIGGSLDPTLAPVTLEQLLMHRGGMVANPQPDIWSEMWSRAAENPSVVMGWAVAEMIQRAPGTTPGTYLYSNAGYMTAGRMVEKEAPGEWQELIRQRVFDPLLMSSCGFGAPSSATAASEPWGHQWSGSAWAPVHVDNPPSMGPAGTVHCSLADWAKFAALHLKGARGESTFLSAASFTRLHTPPTGGDYALGWVVATAPLHQLWHNGSNTLWYAEVWIVPSRDAALLAATNCATTPCQQAVADTIAALRQTYIP